MKNLNKTLAAIIIATTSLNVSAGEMSDDPLITYFKADKLEVRDSDEGSIAVWEFDAWIGRDLEKVWIKYSGERVDGSVESSQIDILYDKAISPYWDVQYGIRQVIDPNGQTWVGAGFMGVAPYLFEIDANAFVNDDGNINLRLDAEYEYMLTRKVVLVPNFEASVFTKEDNANGIVSGFASAELGLRLHYEFKREFSPYIGVNLEKRFGNNVIPTSSETQWLAGLSFWF